MRNANPRTICLTLVLGASCWLGGADPAAAEVPAAPLDPLAFGKAFAEVQAIFVQRCGDCHGAEEPERELNLTTWEGLLKGGASGAVFNPGQARESLLFHLIQKDAKPHMPPDEQLPEAEIATIQKWLNGLPTALAANLGKQIGEQERNHWSFQPVLRPAVPHLKDPWVRTPVDAFVLQSLQVHKFAPAPPASRLELIRRATFDLLGLPPSPDEVQAFLADESPNAYSRLIERLLESPRYGERWGRHWLDLARYADSDGFEFDVDRPDAFRYRDYVIRSFNEDKPYDQFVREQLAGDEIGPSQRELLVATGFCRNGPSINNQSNEKNRLDELDDVISTTGTVFLGLTIGCARCHDHRFEPITQRDYYRFLAIFNSQENRTVPIPTSDEQKKLADFDAQISILKAQLAEVKPREPGRNGEWKAAGDELVQSSKKTDVRLFFGDPNWTDYIVELEAKRTSGAEGFLVAFRAQDLENFHWVNFGGWSNGKHGVETEVQGRRKITIPLQEGNLLNDRWYKVKIHVEGDRFQTFLDGQRVHDFRDERFSRGGVGLGSWATTNRWKNITVKSLDGKVLWLGMPDFTGDQAMSEEQRQELAARRKELESELKERERKRPRVSQCMCVQDTGRNPRETFVLLRGDHRQKGAQVEPGIPSVLSRQELTFAPPPKNATTTTRRSQLAQWITDPRNPLTARVAVNRIWQYHFGQGLVATPSNFGRSGSAPSHPELLDWLADEFVQSGWSFKQMHRLLMLSSVYQQSSKLDPVAMQTDPTNIQLWRFPKRRLDAEEIRDSILAASGNLNLTMFGPGVHPRIHPSVIATGSTQKWPTVNKESSEHWRRSIYVFVKRSVLMPMLEGFDAPTATQSCERRLTTTVATQALQLLNNEFPNEQADYLAQRLLKEAGETPAAQIERAYWLCLSRGPTPEQLKVAEEFLAQQRSYHATRLASATGNAPAEPEAQAARESDTARHALADLCHVLFNLNEFVYVN